MSVKDLAYDIEQLYIDGHSPKMIAAILECPVEIVYDWMTVEGVREASYDPHDTINS